MPWRPCWPCYVIKSVVGKNTDCVTSLMFVSRRVKSMGAPTAAIFTYYDSGSKSTDWYFELWEYDEENEIYIRMKTDSSHSVYTLADTFTTNT